MPARSTYASKTRKRVRTFDGCATCRRRKIKCDGRRPKCHACEKTGVECAGYGVKIQYILYDPLADDYKWPDQEQHTTSSRRPLLTESQRLELSRTVNNAVGIDGIDEAINSPQSHFLGKEDARIYCPFVCLNLESELNHNINNASWEGESTTVGLGSLVEAIVTKSIQCEDLNADVCKVGNTLVLASKSNHSNFAFHTSDPKLPISDPAIRFDQFQDALGGSDDDDLFFSSFVMSPSLWVPSMESQVEIPLQATFLLEHYSSRMVKLFSPRENRKSPWKVLHLPSVMSTFSELTIYGTVNHARSSLFHSLLSLSAFNLDRLDVGYSNMTDHFWKLGTDFRQLAKQHLKEALKSELSGPKRCKYKDMLMSILTMVSICVISGLQDDARSFLLDAEHLIYTRGVPKPYKSRKVRLLHQIYIYLRVIEESTHVYDTTQLAGLDNAETQPPFLPNLQSTQTLFPSLRTHSATQGRDLGSFSSYDCDQELLGESMSTSLFQEVYGIPLELLSFISRTTALANRIDGMRPLCSLVETNVTMNLYLQTQSTALEDEIMSWTAPASPNNLELDFDLDLDLDSDVSSEDLSNTFMLRELILAIHNALVIYFYRRIHNLHPSILQQYVGNVAEHLSAIEQHKLQLGIINNSIAWPGFIAAAEATQPHLQDQLLQWLTNAATSSGFRNYDVAARVAQQVWGARKAGSCSRTSWVDVVRERQLALVLT